MKKLLILLTLVLTTTACSMDSKPANSKPVASENAKHVCIDGVTYIAFKESKGYRGYGFMSIKLNKDSKVVPCSMEVE